MAEEIGRRPFVRAESWRWVFRHPRYLRYMAREFSCFFIGGWTLMMVWGLKSLAEGPAAWAAFLECLGSPAGIAFQVLALVFASYHSLTWFNLTPKALPVQVGEEFVPAGVIAGIHFAAWALVSVFVLALAGAF